jgi:tRNA nucleotidyltransferase (CCA-adding enzyme)
VGRWDTRETALPERVYVPDPLGRGYEVRGRDGRLVARRGAQDNRGVQWQPTYDPPQLTEETIARALREDPAARQAYEALSRAGGHVYVVGGAVRDAHMGREPRDVDLMVTGLPAENVEAALQSTGGGVDVTGQRFGVFRLSVGGGQVEVALPRTERSTGQGHRDFDVRWDHTLPPEADLGRRDFTTNAMAYSPDSNEVIDPHGGRADAAAGVLRTVSPTSFEEDPARVLRAFTAIARQGLTPDSQTLDQLRENASRIRLLPGEVLGSELEKLLEGENPGKAIRIAQQTGALAYLLPDVEAAHGVDQHNPHHQLDVGEHLVEALDGISSLSGDPDLRLAALLHDIGKPDSQWFDESGSAHYYEHPDVPGSADHEDLGASLAETLMRNLRYPEQRVSRVSKLVRLHMFPAFTTARGARRFLRSAGDERTAEDLLKLRAADLMAKGRHKGMEGRDAASLERMRELVGQALDEDVAITPKDLDISGHDIIGVGVPEGPAVGECQRYLLDQVEADPSLNERGQLMELARRWAHQPL